MEVERSEDVGPYVVVEGGTVLTRVESRTFWRSLEMPASTAGSKSLKCIRSALCDGKLPSRQLDVLSTMSF